MLGPLFGGFMLGRHFGLTPIYLTTAVPALIAAGCLFAMSRIPRHDEGDVADAAIGETVDASVTPVRAPA